MGRFVKGDVVVTPFPFSDLSGEKRRPALIVANLSGDDLVICLITSQAASDKYAITLTNADFANGSLKNASNIRPNRLFTADSGLFLYKIGTLGMVKMKEVTASIVRIFSA